MSVPERIEKMKAINKAIIDSYFVVDQNVKLLTPLLEDESVYSKWDYSEGVQGVNAIRLALYKHILSDIRAIMFDSSSKNTASVQTIIPALKDSAFIKGIKDSFCISLGVSILGDHTEEEIERLTKSFQEEDVQRKSDIFDKTLSEVLSTFYELKSSELGRRIDAARSRMISHKEITTVENERVLFDASHFDLTFGDAKKMVTLSQDIIFDINLLLTNSSYSLDSFIGY